MPVVMQLLVKLPCQYKIHVWVGSAWAGWAPLNGVDLFAVCLKVMDTCVLLHGPDLQCHVI